MNSYTKVFIVLKLKLVYVCDKQTNKQKHDMYIINVT